MEQLHYYFFDTDYLFHFSQTYYKRSSWFNCKLSQQVIIYYRIISLIIISYDIERKIGKQFSFLWIKQKYNLNILLTSSDWSDWFLRRPPNWRNFSCNWWSKWPDPYFWVLIFLMNNNCYVLTHFLPISVFFHYPPFWRWITKTLMQFHEVFLLLLKGSKSKLSAS